MFFRKYKIIIFISVVLFAVLIIIFYNLKFSKNDSFLRKMVLETAYPVQAVLSGSIQGVKQAWLRYVLLVGIQEDNKKLRKKNDELKAALVSYQESYHEAQRLRKLLAIADNNQGRFMAARIIGREQAALSRTVLINKGSSDGLRNGMPVIAYPGLIGRLIDVSWHVSRVLLCIDETSNIDAMIQRNRTQGIISGAGSQGMILKYVSKTQDVQKGDVIISSGMGGVFPKGWLIGQVGNVDRKDAGLFLKITVVPFVDLSKLEEVLVLSSEENTPK
ncbi:MAG TPA: rod shape-determining protein MreC [Smithella sp.]|nr:rod shape-determining protein MreC [Smithella sp.]HNY50242.1 rod shape-determining protein MreC [Smithella sp.]HOG89925.1 rod shape-determining protein MreC [Smithella sp.]HQI71929.1 rod shape-determining protein MreC [Smithella sp.]